VPLGGVQIPVVFFVHMREWLDHMNVMHSDQWTRKIHMTTWFCDVEHDGEVLQFNDYGRFVEHMKDSTNHPKRQPPTDLQLDALSRNKQKVLVREEEYSCPLCDCVPDSIEPVIRTGNPKEVKHLLHKHIAKHVETLAFLSVPVLASTDPDQKEASVADAVVKLLLATGKANVDSKDENGQTPLSWAAENGHEAVVKLLQSSIAAQLVTT